MPIYLNRTFVRISLSIIHTGPNGPYNTFLRNRAEGFGVFFSAANSPYQNIVGNEITNMTFPYNVVNYTIQGSNHFLYGNNNKGIIHPTGTEMLIDKSYFYTKKPDFVPQNQWAGIGTPNVMGTVSIPAYDRYTSGSPVSDHCDNLSVSIKEVSEQKENVLVFPNPLNSELKIVSSQRIKNLAVINSLGNRILYRRNIGKSITLDSSKWQDGIYLLLIHLSDNNYKMRVIRKTRSF